MNFNQTEPLVSIITPSWFEKGMSGRYNDINETYFIASRCLKRLFEKTDRELFELILIDNGSTLTTKDIPVDWMPVEEYWKQATKLITNNKNCGFGYAVNQGIAVARGEYILQMNNDVIVLDGWLEAIIEAFTHTELNPPVGMIMPNLIKLAYQKDCVNEKGNKLDIEKVFALKRENLVLRNENIYERGAEFGSLWCMKKKLADKLIEKDNFFFDPRFLYGMSEDRDLYKRVRLLGFETYRTNRTRIGHVGNITITKLKDHKQYTHANREMLKEKWNL